MDILISLRSLYQKTKPNYTSAFRTKNFLVVYDERSPNELVVLCDSPNVFLVQTAIMQMWVWVQLQPMDYMNPILEYSSTGRGQNKSINQ